MSESYYKKLTEANKFKRPKGSIFFLNSPILTTRLLLTIDFSHPKNEKNKYILYFLFIIN